MSKLRGLAVVFIAICGFHCGSVSAPQEDLQTCSDGLHNNTEVGIDCGGEVCRACQTCDGPEQCDSKVCIDGNCATTQLAQCVPVHPENASSETKDIVLLFTEGVGWSEETPCEWSCDRDYFETETDTCINERMEDCISNPPANAHVPSVIEVPSHFTTDTGWVPDPCPWQCNTGFSPTDTSCIVIPGMPGVIGEESAGHTNVTWQWTLPLGTDHFVYTINSGTPQTVGNQTRSVTQTLNEGSHTIRVKACNSASGCSSEAMYTTQVKFFGTKYSPAWQGVSKSDLAESPLGNTVPLSCHNCYNGINNVLLSTSDANKKISKAVERSADLIEIDIVDIGGVLYALHDDTSTVPRGIPTLQELLDNPTLRDSEAMLFLEIKERGTDPAQFAELLMSVMEKNTDFVHNGRLLFIRAFADQFEYVTAVKNLAAKMPFLAPYLRYHLLYKNHGNIDAWQSAIKVEVFDRGFHGVEIQFASENLFSILNYAKSLNLTTGIWTVPKPFLGEVALATMREDVDQITTEYQIDEARKIVEATTSAGYINSTNVNPFSSPVLLPVLSNLSGSVDMETRTLSLSSGASFGSPKITIFDPGQVLFGSVLNFGAPNVAIKLFQTEANATEGFLVTAVVRFKTLANLPQGQTMAILNKSQGGGFALELHRPTGKQTVLRFGVFTTGPGSSGYRYHTYPVAGAPAGGCNNANGSFSKALNTTDSYVLTGVYDGDGGVYLLINNQCASTSRPIALGSPVANGVSSIIGADPQPDASTGARFYFDGYIQQAQVQRWGEHSGHTAN